MTTNTIILATTPEIRAACDRVDDAVGRALSAMSRTVSNHAAWGRYEADREAVKMFLLASRSIEGVLTLARTDLVLLPPAILAARGAFETLLKAAWLVDCDDPMDRELRWVQHLRSEERAWSRTAGHLRKAGQDPTWASSNADRTKAFREHVEKAFPAGYVQLPGSPSVEEMIETLHEKRLYTMYTFMSQYMHGDRIASSLYDRMTERSRDAVRPDDWSIPLKVCWISLARASRLILSRIGGNPDDFMTPLETTEVDAFLNAIDEASSRGEPA